MSKTIKIIISLLIVLGVVFVAIKIFPGTRVKKSLCYNQKNLDLAYERGWNDLKKRVGASGHLSSAPLDSRQLGVSGTVAGIEKNIIRVKIQTFDPLADPDLDERYVVIEEKTKINEQELKSEEQFQEEWSRFQRESQTQQIGESEASAPPSRYVIKAVSASALETGQLITVSTNRDIKREKKFIADEIVINLLRNQ